MYYVLELYIRVKSYDHLNFSTGSVIQFRASRYIMRLNHTFEWKVMTIWNSREILLFNSEHHDILCAWIGDTCDKLWPFEFLDRIRYSISSVSIYYAPKSHIRMKGYDHLKFSRYSVVQFRASRYIMRLNRRYVWQVMTIWISREVPLFNFERLDILSPWIGHPCKMLWQFKFLEGILCSISSVSIYYVPESDIRVKSCEHWNFSIASVVQFRASWHIRSPNRASVWKLETI